MIERSFEIIKSLNSHKVDYKIIGGYAIIMHGYLRGTEDLDLLIKMTEENVKSFQTALNSIYKDDDISQITYDELEKYSVIRYGSPDNFYIDIISKIGDLFSFHNVEAIEKEVDGIKFRYASLKSLLEMKKNTYREKDKLDVLFLEEKIKNDKKI